MGFAAQDLEQVVGSFDAAVAGPPGALQGEMLNGRLAPIAAVLADDTLTYRRVMLGAERLSTGDDLYRVRSSRHLWGIVAAFGTVLRVLVLWTRRSEFALYRSLGARRGDVSLIAAAEYVLVVAWSLLIALGATAIIVATIEPGPFVWAPAVPSFVAAVCATLLGGLAAAALVPTARPLDVLKDR